MTKMSMSETMAKHNELAARLGVKPVTNFKSLSAARAALNTLENRMNQEASTNEAPFDTTTEATAPEGPAPIATSDAKYNSSGKRGPTQGIGAFCKELIVEGKTNAEILAAVAEKFPTAKTTTNCVAYYRAKLIKAAKEAAAPVTTPDADSPAPTEEVAAA